MDGGAPSASGSAMPPYLPHMYAPHPHLSYMGTHVQQPHISYTATHAPQPQPQPQPPHFSQVAYRTLPPGGQFVLLEPRTYDWHEGGGRLQTGPLLFPPGGGGAAAASGPVPNTPPRYVYVRPGVPGPIREQHHQTTSQMCRFFDRGYCRAGSQCAFSHGPWPPEVPAGHPAFLAAAGHPADKRKKRKAKKKNTNPNRRGSNLKKAAFVGPLKPLEAYLRVFELEHLISVCEEKDLDVDSFILLVSTYLPPTYLPTYLAQI